MKLLLLPSSLRQTILTRPCHTQQTQLRLFSRSCILTAGKPIQAQGGQGDRSYEHALALLETLQSNRAIRSSIADASRDKNQDAIPEMLEWSRMAGYGPRDLMALGSKYIHIAGTKGKGSVGVMIENILLQYAKKPDEDKVAEIHTSTKKLEYKPLGGIGLYTSPHLVTVRERIRIDGVPISEKLFARYFFELWDRFGDAASNSNITSSTASDVRDIENRPGYFRYLTLLALHSFAQEGVKIGIIECGIGGEYDSTNILPSEAVAASAITSLGIDHTAMLGETIEEISWHKGGILKKGVPAFTMDQKPEALAILEGRAAEKGIQLTSVPRLLLLDNSNLQLGLLGDFQKDNASLAVAVTASYLRDQGAEGIPSSQELSLAETKLPDQFIQGLNTVYWPGRCEVIKDGNLEWFVDGAHTKESIEAVGNWFHHKMDEANSETNPPTAVFLIFNQDERDGDALLRKLITTLQISVKSTQTSPVDRFPDKTSSGKPITVRQYTRVFRYASFCPNKPFPPLEGEEIPRDLSIQKALERSYRTADGNTLTHVYDSVHEAVMLARTIAVGDGERVLVLVTGSLHLVGAFFQVFESTKKLAESLPKDDIEDEDL